MKIIKRQNYVDKKYFIIKKYKIKDNNHLKYPLEMWK